MALFRFIKDRVFLIKHSNMVKWALAFSGLFLTSTGVMAQFYYKDIVSNQQLRADMARLKEQKVRKISISSFEDDGSPSEGFFCEKKINRNYTEVQMMSRSNITGPSEMNSRFDEKGLLTESSDSSEIAATTTTYSYDEQNRIRLIRSSVRSSDDDFAGEIVEEHIYSYNTAGVPEKMIRVKNGTDSSVVEFKTDEKNNVTIEKNSKTGETYYYYYDPKNRLTDVVKENPFNHKLLPDYMFEYNSAGLISQMTTTEEGGSYYYIWKYSYDNGLRITERCYSKEKRLMGSIQYEYQ